MDAPQLTQLWPEEEAGTRGCCSLSWSAARHRWGRLQAATTNLFALLPQPLCCSSPPLLPFLTLPSPLPPLSFAAHPQVVKLKHSRDKLLEEIDSQWEEMDRMAAEHRWKEGAVWVVRGMHPS